VIHTFRRFEFTAGAILPSIALFRYGHQQDFRAWKIGVSFSGVAATARNVRRIPTNEAQVRPLTDLEQEMQREVWLQAVDTAPMGK
jgi:hypothetical protein